MSGKTSDEGGGKTNESAGEGKTSPPRDSGHADAGGKTAN